jgi:aspartate racemase
MIAKKINQRPGAIGVLGGTGPVAGAQMHLELLALAQSRYGAENDTDYPDIVVINRPIPGIGSDGLDSEGVGAEYIREGIAELVGLGSKTIVSVCNSLSSLIKGVRIPGDVEVVDIISATCNALDEGVNVVGVLSSRALRDSGDFERALLAKGIVAVALDDAHQDMLDDVIFDIMGGRHARVSGALSLVTEYLTGNGATHIIAGCTELSVVNINNLTKCSVIDSVSAAAGVAIERSYGGRHEN